MKLTIYMTALLPPTFKLINGTMDSEGNIIPMYTGAIPYLEKRHPKSISLPSTDKISVIKLYRIHSWSGLKEAKDFVDTMVFQGVTEFEFVNKDQ